MAQINVKGRVEARLGERVYSADEINAMMHTLRLSKVPGIDRIRGYAKRNNLGVTTTELEIQGKRLYYIKSSKLDVLAEGLGFPFTGKQLGETLTI